MINRVWFIPDEGEPREGATTDVPSWVADGYALFRFEWYSPSGVTHAADIWSRTKPTVRDVVRAANTLFNAMDLGTLRLWSAGGNILLP